MKNVGRYRFIQAKRARRRVWALVLVLPALLLSGCRAIQDAQKEALALETAMHARMAKGDFAGIFDAADPEYQKAEPRDKSDALFGAIARKLGSPLDCTPGNFNISTTTGGLVIHSECTTRFSKDATAQERFVWRKSGTQPQYRLFGYHIESNALLER